MDQIADYGIAALLVMAGGFGLVGSFGLMKLPDTMTRLHAPTKATTLGVGGVLVASMLHFWIYEGVLSWHEFLITLFLLLTAPITANFIAKAHMHLSEHPETIIDPHTGRDWATFVDADKPVGPDMTGETLR